MRLTRGADGGSSAAIGLAISAALMAAAFMMANLMVEKPSTGGDARASSYESMAQSALEVMVRDAGRTSSGLSWGVDADNMTRFGLALSGQPNFIDYVKVRALRNGTLVSGTNKAPDYPEVKFNLGLEGADFHLRSYPVLPGLDDPRWIKNPHGRVAYFGHYNGGAAPVNISASITNSSSTMNVSLELKNKGLADAVYQVTFELADPAGGRDKLDVTKHSKLVPALQEGKVWARFDRLPSWDSDFKAIHVKVIDPYGRIAIDENNKQVGDFWLYASPPVGGSNGYNILVTAAERYYIAGDPVKFAVDHYDGNGEHVANAKAKFSIYNPAGVEIVNATIDLPKTPNSVYTYTCNVCTGVGNYTAVAWDTGYSRRVSDFVHVSAAKMFTEKKTPAPNAVTEMGLIASLVEQFNPTRYDAATNPAGDVFGDDSNGPSELIDVIDRYSFIVIGSEVTQTSLDAAITKYGLRDWVTKGGTLIVLGTMEQESNWLEPIYHAAQANANGGISAPDPTHPVLVTPNRLSYDRYLDNARAWDVDQDAPFTHVLTRGAQGTSVQDTLTLASPGTLGEGTVILTSYMPSQLTSPQDTLEARKLLHNLFSQAYTMLFIDYGPPVPDVVSVGSSQRLVAVPHPLVPGAVVEVKLVMYVFG